MKVLNLIWGFTLGAGIDKCFLTYARLGEVDPEVEVKSACINILSLDSHIKPLQDIGAELIDIESRKDFSWVGKLAKLIKEYQPDVVFTHGFNGAIVMLIVRMLKGIKVKCVFSYHGLYNPPTASRKILEPIYNGLPVWIYKHIASKTISVSKDSRQQLLDRGVPADKVVTVYNGIVDKTITGTVPVTKDCVTFMSASRIDQIKGLNYLLDALAVIKSKGIPFHYYLVGEGPELQNLKDQANRLGLNDEITFAGYQTNVAEWLNSVDMFTIPSLQENHSIALLEAMRAGKAIIASNVGGNGESIIDGKDGLLVPSKDTQALVVAFEKMLTDPQLRATCAAGARKRFEDEFTEEAMMRNLVKVLKS